MAFSLFPFALIVALATPAAVAAHSPEAELSAVDALETCKMLSADFDGTMTKLAEAGWTPAPEGNAAPPNWSGNAAVLRKPGLQIIFGSEGADSKGRYNGVCQVFLPGNSVMAATQIAAHLDIPASDYAAQSEAGMHISVSHSIRFVNEDHITRVANIPADDGRMLFEHVSLKEE